MRLVIFDTHPIQYKVPIWRTLASTEGLDVNVIYFSDISVRGGMDPGFGRPVAWDRPLLEGYSHQFVKGAHKASSRSRLKLRNPRRFIEGLKAEWLLISGYTHPFERQIARYARHCGSRVLVRGEFFDNVPRPRFKSILRRQYLRWFYENVDQFCYIGEAARQHLRAYGISDESMSFSPYAVESQFFEEMALHTNRENARRSLGFDDNTFVFLWSSKFTPRKNPELLLAAMKRLSSLDQVGLIMLGDGILREATLKMGRALLGDRLVAPGFINQSELGNYFKAADAFVHSSNFETWGLVVNEAMYFRLPVIVGDKVACRRDLVDGRSTGLVFETGDPTSLASAMAFYLANRDKAVSDGNRGLQIVKKYSVQAAAKGILLAIGHGLSNDPPANDIAK